jgi:serine/threonine-protein kinase HipA
MNDVGIIEIDLNSNNAKLNYDDNWKNIGFELSPHLKFDKEIDSNSIKNLYLIFYQKVKD